MSPIMTGVVGLASLLVLLMFGMPIGFAMLVLGFTGFAYLTSFTGAVNILVNTPYALISSYDYAVIPLFIFMAALCNSTGLGQGLFRMANAWLGRIPGGLSIATIGSCAVFGAASASSIATTATIGTVALPEMKRYNYDPGLSVGCVAAGGTLGIIIPPSGILMIYGIIAQQDIGKLFIAGLLPGILLAVMFLIMIVVRVKLKPSLAPLGPKTTLKEKVFSILDSFEMLVVIILAIVGLLVGWFTPTEAGAVGAFGALIMSLVRRRLTWEAFKSATMETVRTGGMIFAVLIGALVFTSFLAVTTIPMEVAEWVGDLGWPPMAVMIFILLMYVVMGTFLEEMAMILLTLPIFFPVVVALGFDPIWFGIIIVVVVIMGMISPPVGITMFVAKGIAPDIPMSTIYRGVLPFLAISVVFTALLLAFPQIALWLPGLFG